MQKLDIFGENYISQHIIKTIKAQNVEQSYRIYITDCLHAIAHNTTQIITGKGIENVGRSMSKRWIDIIEPPKPTEEMHIDCLQFASDMWDRAQGKEVKANGA